MDRSAVAQARRAGARRAHVCGRLSWKDNARCAVALSFDSDHETNELRDGGKSIGRMSWGQYGNRVAMPRILALLRKYDVPASFYVPAVVALLYPDEQRRSPRTGTRSASTAGSTSSTRRCPTKPSAI